MSDKLSNKDNYKNKQFVNVFFNEHDDDSGFDAAIYFDPDTKQFLLLDNDTDEVIAAGDINDIAYQTENATGHFADELASHIAGHAFQKGFLSRDDASNYNVDFSDYEDDDENIPVVDMPDDFDHASDRDQQRYFYMAMETLRDKGTLESSTDDDIMALAEQLYDTDNKRKDDTTQNIVQAINRKY